MVVLKFLSGLAILIVLVLFSIQNMEPSVTITYYINKATPEIPFSFALLGAAAIGSVITALATLVEHFRLRSAIRRQAKHISEMEAELLEFRSQPPEPVNENLPVPIDQSDKPEEPTEGKT